MTRRWIAILAGLLLAACGGNVRQAEMARYDLGAPTEKWAGSRIPVAAVEVRAASWLAGPAMHYRLAHAEPLRRQSYAESRWAAPPAELLEAYLGRRVVFGQADFNGKGCRLTLVLHELEQRFDDPQRSVVVLDARAVLTPWRGAEVLAQRAFLISRPAQPDARGGVAAARDAARTLADEMAIWLEQTGGEKPAIVERCRA